MNDKKAKALRRVARAAGLPVESMYLIHKRTGVVRLGKCFRGLVRNLKKRVRRGELPNLNRYSLSERGAHAARAGS